MSFNLNRYYLIKDNNEEFPDQVLQELVLTTGKNVSLEQTMNRRNAIIDYLKNYKYEISTTFSELTDNDFEKISNFVSSDSKKWTKRNMLDAMKDIVAINYDTDIDKITFGRKNNNEVYNYDLLMTYNLCCKKEIELARRARDESSHD